MEWADGERWCVGYIRRRFGQQFAHLDEWRRYLRRVWRQLPGGAASLRLQPIPEVPIAVCGGVLMLLLVATTDKLQLTTDSTATVDVHASGAEVNDSTFATNGLFKQNTAISSATTTDIVA